MNEAFSEGSESRYCMQDLHGSTAGSNDQHEGSACMTLLLRMLTDTLTHRQCYVFIHSIMTWI